MAVYLGIDLGTSGIKLALVDASGGVVAEAEASYDVIAPESGWAETDPSEWVRALEHGAGSVSPALRGTDLGAVGVAGQMHGTVLVDDGGRPVRNAVLWPDRRATTQLELWRSLPQAQLARLVNPLVAGMTGPVLAWLSSHEPERVDTATKVLLPKDYLRSVLTGDVGTDRSDASATLLWDMVSDDWSDGSGRLIDTSLLPAVAPSDQVVGTTEWLADLIDGPREVPVVAGCADTAATLVALAATEIGASASLIVNLGTGSQIVRPRVPVRPRVDPVAHTYADAEHGAYAMIGVQNGGLALSWVQRLLGLSWPDFVTSAAAADDSSGVSFVPFLSGERGGLAGPASRGAWVGLTEGTSPPQLARAAFEAMAFSVRRAVELTGDTSAGPVLLSGGGGREPFVQQLLADVLGTPVERIDLRSASAVGAAVLAARGAGRVLGVPVRPGHVEPRSRRRLESAYARWCGRLAAGDL